MTDRDAAAFYRYLNQVAVKGDELEELPDMESLIEGVLYRNSLAWMVGASGHGKTFLGIDIAAHVSRGMSWHGHETQPGNVLYVIAEPGKLKSRIEAWESEHRAALPDVTFIPASVLLCDGEQRKGFIRYAKEISPALIVFDTQARMTLDLEENSAKEMGRFVSALDEIREATGACVLTIHHPDKAGTGLRGSNATLGAAQTVLQVEKKAGYIELSFPKQKDDQDDKNMLFRLVPSMNSLVVRDEVQRVSEPYTPVGGRADETSVKGRRSFKKSNALGPAIGKALDFIKDNPGSNAKQVMSGAGVTRATAYRAIQLVKDEGHGVKKVETQEAGSNHTVSEGSARVGVRPLPRRSPVQVRGAHTGDVESRSGGSETTEATVKRPLKSFPHNCGERGIRHVWQPVGSPERRCQCGEVMWKNAGSQPQKPRKALKKPDPRPTTKRPLKTRQRPSERATGAIRTTTYAEEAAKAKEAREERRRKWAENACTHGRDPDYCSPCHFERVKKSKRSTK